MHISYNFIKIIDVCLQFWKVLKIRITGSKHSTFKNYYFRWNRKSAPGSGAKREESRAIEHQGKKEIILATQNAQ